MRSINHYNVPGFAVSDYRCVSRYERRAPVAGRRDDYAVRRVGLKGTWKPYAVHRNAWFNRQQPDTGLRERSFDPFKSLLPQP